MLRKRALELGALEARYEQELSAQTFEYKERIRELTGRRYPVGSMALTFSGYDADTRVLRLKGGGFTYVGKVEPLVAKAMRDQLEVLVVEMGFSPDKSRIRGFRIVAPGGKGSVPFTKVPEAGDTVRNEVDGLTYVGIPAGRFQMGCSPRDGECSGDEKPGVMVEISNGFWMGQTEVPQGAYERVMGSNPSRFKGSDRPVESVTWQEASAYCAKVGGRLPTEAEWERAARGGTSDARYGALDRIGWYNGNSGSQTQRVGGKEANRYGLHDMLGNVWEWTGDWYQDKLPGGTDPRGPATGNQRVLRGGSWGDYPGNLRASNRSGFGPSYRYDLYGFRCVWE